VSGDHEFGGYAETAMGALDGDGGDVAVGLFSAFCAFFHFGKDVAHNVSSAVLCHEQQVLPRHKVVEIVPIGIILWQAPNIAILHLGKIVDPCSSNLHHFE